MAKKVSIYNVAEAAHVSPATVSYVINGKGKISEKTKKEVIKAMNVMGYIPDHAAISLSTGKSKLIGLSLPYDDASNGMSSNPFYAEFISSFLKGLSLEGYDLVIGSLKSEKSLLSWLQSHSFEGLVLFGLYSGASLSALRKMGIPSVLVDVYNEEAHGFNNIRVNDLGGVYLATSYLIEKGHQSKKI